MRKTDPARWLAAAALTAALLAACGGPRVYHEEAFEQSSPYQQRLPLPAATACGGARRALLSQGYVVDDSRPDRLKGVKQFQPDADTHVVMEFTVVCADDNGASTLYANATQARYDLKKTRQSAGLSVPSVGSISLPWGSSTESLVKVGGETVSDEAFYARFFQLTRKMLGLPPKNP